VNDVVEIILSAQQARQFRDILEEQRINAGHIFAFVSRSFEPDAGCSVVKFQAKRVSKKIAQKCAALIREYKDD
jgi:hypothetical protein